MKISLCPVDKSNYEAVCDLEVREDQEDYVASNMWSLVEAQFNSGYETRAISCDDKVVGFLMWVQETSDKTAIWRFMLDIKHQNKGIGRQALAQAIEQIKQTPELKQIEICYNPNNPVAKDFYSSFGFVEIGMDDDDEDMLAIIKL